MILWTYYFPMKYHSSDFKEPFSPPPQALYQFRVGTSLIKFGSELFIFCQISEWPERFAHDPSFLLSNLSKSFTVTHLSWSTWAICSLRSKEMSEPFAFLKTLKNGKKFLRESLIFCKQTRKWAICSKNRAICSFVLSNLSESLTFAYLSWAT